MERTSKWHIDPGVTGKHYGLSYCEACDYVPPRIIEFDPAWCEDRRGPQPLTRYCPNCGCRMLNGKEI